MGGSKLGRKEGKKEKEGMGRGKRGGGVTGREGESLNGSEGRKGGMGRGGEGRSVDEEREKTTRFT